MSEPLPAGWTGNNAVHHTDRGPFRLEVWKGPRYAWRLSVGQARVATSDPMGLPDAATARAAVLARLAEIVGEVDEVPVALTVADLPGAEGPHLPAVVVDRDGRPRSVLAYAAAGRVRPYELWGNVERHFPAGTEVYPESAAPALWRAYLRGRS